MNSEVPGNKVINSVFVDICHGVDLKYMRFV